MKFRLLFLLTIIGLTVSTVASAADGARQAAVSDIEKHFELITVGPLAFTNVWVHRQTNYNILIRHDGGIHTIKLTDLPKKELEELKPQIGELANIEEEKPALMTRWNEMQADSELQGQARAELEKATNVLKALMVPLLVCTLVMHLFFSYLFKRLCDRTETKSGLAVWIPVVQWAPILRAAGISDIWAGLVIGLTFFPSIGISLYMFFSGAPVDQTSPIFMVAGGLSLVAMVLGAIVSIVWCFKICSRCDKSPWLGFLMFLPVVNLLLLGYLAFSNDND